MSIAQGIMNSDKKQWFVLQAMYSRAVKAQEMLTNLEIETFVPMEKRKVVVKGKKIQEKMVPALRNMLFVKSTFSRIREIKAVNKYLWYLTHTLNGSIEPIIVPDDQMTRFVEFVEGRFEDIEYIDHETIDLKKGEKVKIIAGAFQGKEANFIKITGKRNKQLVVAIDGVLAVAIKTPCPNMIIEKI
ncbi:MAG: UpxY family transcription antiterminator [Rikenellaceae bacterium]